MRLTVQLVLKRCVTGTAGACCGVAARCVASHVGSPGDCEWLASSHVHLCLGEVDEGVAAGVHCKRTLATVKADLQVSVQGDSAAQGTEWACLFNGQALPAGRGLFCLLHHLNDTLTVAVPIHQRTDFLCVSEGA